MKTMTMFCFIMVAVMIGYVFDVDTLLVRADSPAVMALSGSPHEDPIMYDQKYIDGKMPYYGRAWVVKKPVVIMGDSNSALPWAEILGRSDVGTRAIPGFCTTHMAPVVEHVIAESPRKAVLMIGTNDLWYGSKPQDVADRTVVIVQKLQDQKIEVVLFTVPHFGIEAADGKHDIADINRRVKETNALLTAFAETNGIEIYDLNSALAPEGILLPEYNMGDGTHFSREAVGYWATLMSKATLIE